MSKQDKGGAERRRYPRRDQKFLVKFKAIGGAHHQDIGERVGLVLNISRGGLVLSTKREFPPDTIFEIKIPATPLGAARTVKGMVVWTKAKSESGEYEAGCTFVRIVMPEEPERRAHPRKPSKLPLSLTGPDDEDSHEGVLQDLSQGGIEFLSPQLYPKHTVLRVGFPESPLGGARVVHVEVLRVSVTDKPGWARVAGRFVTE